MSELLPVYSRFAPFIREYVYQERWNTLHDIQEKSPKEIFDSNDHVLIAAGTARGKTEAAFFPILSVLDTIIRSGKKAFVLYISPLKALINDQAKRLERLLYSGRDTEKPLIPIWRWHGDVEGSSKKRFCEDPSGILLITPESLESLLLRRSRETGRIFSSLLFIVIDEVHVFMGSDRGSQLICQFSRIEKAILDHSKPGNKTTPDYTISVRRIGLSATLGDYEGGRFWLSQGTNLNTALVEETNDSGKELSLALDYHVFRSRHKKDPLYYQALYDQCRNKRAIIFTNSRLEAEECAASLSRYAAENREPDVFQVHHGSISALLRDEAEETLKTGEGPQIICATATLELGIDIGDLDRIIQLDSPWSVSAFVQRLGRSGRRSGRAEMYFCITGTSQGKGCSAIPWKLLHTMAVIQLYLEEKWIEPPAVKPLPYSLLIHQILAILASLGEHSLETLASLVLSFPPFKEIPAEDFRTLLVWLEKCGCIGITEEGKLILGLEGERIVNRHSFYPVFPGEETFRVVLEGREIGTVNFVPDPQSVLVVGGQRWTVKNIDPLKREIWVAETEDEGNERLWKGRGSGIHSRIAEKIKQILLGIQNLPIEAIKTNYPYLSTAACNALEAGAQAARDLGITGFSLVSDEYQSSINGKSGTDAINSIFLFPWTGSAGMKTISMVLSAEKTRKTLRIVYFEEEELYFHIVTKFTFSEFRPVLQDVLQKALDTDFLSAIINQKSIPYTDKYDYLLPPELLAKQYAANMLDKAALKTLD